MKMKRMSTTVAIAYNHRARRLAVAKRTTLLSSSTLITTVNKKLHRRFLMDDFIPTTRMFSRSLREAYPKDYVNENIIEGPFYSAPNIHDVPVLFGLIAVLSMIAVAIWRYF
jgi:hypothetical protein